MSSMLFTKIVTNIFVTKASTVAKIPQLHFAKSTYFFNDPSISFISNYLSALLKSFSIVGVSEYILYLEYR